MMDKDRQKFRRIARRFLEDPVPPRTHRETKNPAEPSQDLWRREHGDGRRRDSRG